MRTTYTDELGITRCRLCRSKRCARIPALSRSRSYTPCDPAKRDKRSLRSPLQPHPRMSRSAAESINRTARAERKAHVRRAGLPAEQARRARELARLARVAEAPSCADTYTLRAAAALSHWALVNAETFGVRLPRSHVRYHRCRIALAEALRG